MCVSISLSVDRIIQLYDSLKFSTVGPAHYLNAWWVQVLTTGGFYFFFFFYHWD